MTVSYKDIISFIVDPLLLPSPIISFGSDPEFFFVRDGLVVPSTEVVTPNIYGVVTDGFQAELNPSSSTCRYLAGKSLMVAIDYAQRLANKAKATLSFQGSYRIDDATWKRTPMSLRRFGCNPTLNAYETLNKRVTGLRERFRAAGGHIHLGIKGLNSDDKKEFVKLLDVVVGNTCVLFDIDPNQETRRKNYGRAGEYREKLYGLEYRVPSNFWLKHYALWSMVTGLCRNALQLRAVKLSNELMKRIDVHKVREAINTNNKQLAIETFLIVRDFFNEKRLCSSSGMSITNTEKFSKWALMEDPVSLIVNKNAAPKAIVNNWNQVGDGTDGFESTLAALDIK